MEPSSILGGHESAADDGLLVNAALVALAQPPGRRFITSSPDYGNRVVFRRDSTYHQIVVRDFNRLRTLYFDLTTQSRMSLDDPLEGGFDYTEYFHMPMVLNPAVRKVLFIGLGGATGPKQFLHDYPEVHIDVAEIDPLVVEVAERLFSLPTDPRLRIFVADGRAFIKRAPTKYDLIVIDAYTTNRYGALIPTHLTTREFLAECVEHLSDRGLLLFHLATDPRTLIARSIAKTIETSLPHQVIFARPGGTEIVASRANIRLSPEDLSRRIGELRAKGLLRRQNLDEKVSTLLPGPLDSVGVRVLTDDYAPVDLLLRRAWGSS